MRPVNPVFTQLFELFLLFLLLTKNAHHKMTNCQPNWNFWLNATMPEWEWKEWAKLTEWPESIWRFQKVQLRQPCASRASWNHTFLMRNLSSTHPSILPILKDILYWEISLVFPCRYRLRKDVENRYVHTHFTKAGY